MACMSASAVRLSGCLAKPQPPAPCWTIGVSRPLNRGSGSIASYNARLSLKSGVHLPARLEVRAAAAAAEVENGSTAVAVQDLGGAAWLGAFFAALANNFTVDAPLLLKVMATVTIYNAVATVLMAAPNKDEVTSIIAPCVLAAACLGLNGGDYGTITVGIFSFFTLKGLGLPTYAWLGIFATFFPAVIKGFGPQWLTAACAASSAISLYRGSKGLKGVLDAGILAATAYVVYKGIFPLWVTCGGISAAIWSAVAHTLAVLKV
eukprot:jgi/Botrbrau1/22890/Bobra.0065s0043.1